MKTVRDYVEFVKSTLLECTGQATIEQFSGEFRAEDDYIDNILEEKYLNMPLHDLVYANLKYILGDQEECINYDPPCFEQREHHNEYFFRMILHEMKKDNAWSLIIAPVKYQWDITDCMRLGIIDIEENSNAQLSYHTDESFSRVFFVNDVIKGGTLLLSDGIVTKWIDELPEWANQITSRHDVYETPHNQAISKMLNLTRNPDAYWGERLYYSPANQDVVTVLMNGRWWDVSIRSFEKDIHPDYAAEYEMIKSIMP